MEKNEIKKTIEALIFVSFKPVVIKHLVESLEEAEEIVIECLNELINEYAQKGMNIIKVAEGYQMVSNPSSAPFIEKLYRKASKQFLSRAALETLSIIAFKQPITRGQIENIRGVNSDKIVNNLIDKKLIKEAGKADILGKPTLYATTREFLQYFNLNSIEEIPEFELFSRMQLEYNPTDQNINTSKNEETIIDDQIKEILSENIEEENIVNSESSYNNVVKFEIIKEETKDLTVENMNEQPEDSINFIHYEKKITDDNMDQFTVERKDFKINASKNFID